MFCFFDTSFEASVSNITSLQVPLTSSSFRPWATSRRTHLPDLLTSMLHRSYVSPDPLCIQLLHVCLCLQHLLIPSIPLQHIHRSVCLTAQLHNLLQPSTKLRTVSILIQYHHPTQFALLTSLFTIPALINKPHIHFNIVVNLCSVTYISVVTNKE